MDKNRRDKTIYKLKNLLQSAHNRQFSTPDVNYKRPSGDTILHIACYERRFDIVIFLLKHGANPTIENVKGDNALHALLRYNPNEPKQVKTLMYKQDYENTVLALLRHSGKTMSKKNVHGLAPLDLYMDQCTRTNDNMFLSMGAIFNGNIKNDKKKLETYLHLHKNRKMVRSSGDKLNLFDL